MHTTHNESPQAETLFELFEKLTPQVIENDDKVTQNLQALNYAINEPTIKNIALTGSYGSGKSSILKTLEHQHPEHNYLRISLASFNDPEDPKNQNPPKQQPNGSLNESRNSKKSNSSESKKEKSAENLEPLLELSILQQIFYHVDHESIPDSRFKRIISLGKDTILDFQIASIIWIISAWYLFFPDSLQFEFVRLFNRDILKGIALILFLAGLAKLLSHLRRIYNNAKVNKLNIQSGEVELEKGVEQSILNKHIDEIIYFFEVTDYNVVMIEDLDRFNNTAIFGKLREINLLINNSRQINRGVNFIYAVRDDIFEDSHRTKFFDFFIPVIPVSDPSNAADLLNKSFEKLSKLTPSEDFVSDVASFIPDMRFLNNVFNEYLLYESNIKGNLIPEKRLAIILYKNLYPKDFIKLQHGKGDLYKVLRRRNELVKELTQDINKKIDTTNQLLAALKDDLVLQEQELRSIYINAIQNSVRKSIGIIIENEFVEFATLNDEIIFNKIPREELILHRCLNSFSISQPRFSTANGKSLQEIENEVNSEFSYKDRLEQIRGKMTENKLTHQLASQKEELTRLRHLSLGALFSNISNLKNFGEFKNDQLIIYMLKNGYIDENYISYISYFYEGQITATDFKFYQHVIAETTNPFDFDLMNTANLIQKIAPRHFLTGPVLNLSLADQLIANQEQFPSRYELFFQQVVNKSETSKDFIIYYAKHGQYSGQFLAEVFKLWPSVWELLVSHSELDKKERDEHLLELLERVDAQALIENIANSEIKSYIVEDAQILNILHKAPRETVEKLIKETPIYFSRLENSEDREIQELLKFIYTSGHWKYTDAMALTACQLFIDEAIKTNEVKERPFTLLNSIDEIRPIIIEDISQFVEDLLLERSNLKEAPDAFLELLNNSSISLKHKMKIISRQTNESKIERLQEIKDLNVQNLLLESGKVEPVWMNVLDYYNEQNEITKPLIKFLNKYEVLEFDEDEISEADAFKSDLLRCNDIEFEIYKILIKTLFKKPYNELDFEKLSRKKVSFLIEAGILPLNTKMFSYLKKHFEGSQIQLAEKHPADFLSKISTLSLDTEDLNQLLSSSNVDDEFKFWVISSYKDEIPQLNDETSRKLSSLLLKINILDLPTASINHLILSAEDEKSAIEVLLKYGESLSLNEVKAAVRELPPRFHKVLRKRNRLKLPKTQVFIDLGNFLEDQEIATIKIKSDSVVISGSYKDI